MELLISQNKYIPSSKMLDSNQFELDHQLSPSIPAFDEPFLWYDTFLQMKLAEFLVK